jgi:hypothetical protein
MSAEELLSKNEKRFLIISNYIIGITVFLDLIHITGIYSMPLEIFTFFNLIVLGSALQNYRIKRRVNEQLANKE